MAQLKATADPTLWPQHGRLPRQRPCHHLGGLHLPSFLSLGRGLDGEERGIWGNTAGAVTCTWTTTMTHQLADAGGLTRSRPLGSTTATITTLSRSAKFWIKFAERRKKETGLSCHTSQSIWKRMKLRLVPAFKKRINTNQLYRVVTKWTMTKCRTRDSFNSSFFE